MRSGPWWALLSIAACTNAPPLAPPDDRPPVDGGSGPRCTPASCEGCCGDDDVCHVGTNDDECGAAGASCSDCAASGATCRDSACLAPGCGDGVVAIGEACEAGQLGNASCRDLGFAGGTIACGADCQLDASACLPLSCALAEQDREHLPCSFCAPDGQSEIYCGFCRVDPNGQSLPDAIHTCDPGLRCYSWDNAADMTTIHACLSAPPEACVFSEGYCEGDHAINCSNGRLDRYDCADSGRSCQVTAGRFGTYPACIEPGAVQCSPDTFTESCAGDDRVVCSNLDFYSRHEPCDPGTRCRDLGGVTRCVPDGSVSCDPVAFVTRCQAGARVECEVLVFGHPELGGIELSSTCGTNGTCAQTAIDARCVQLGTAACDPASYVRHCDGDRSRACAPGPRWEYYDDCSAHSPEALACAQFTNGPACVPHNYTPCTPGVDMAMCNAGTASWCMSPGFLRSEVCPSLNPTCTTAGGLATCVAPGAVSCSYDPARAVNGTDRYGMSTTYRPLRCIDAGTLAACEGYSQKEIRIACRTQCVDHPASEPNLDASCR